MALRYTSIARRQSSFCSNFRAVSLSFSRFMRLGRRRGIRGIKAGIVETYRVDPEGGRLVRTGVQVAVGDGPGQALEVGRGRPVGLEQGHRRLQGAEPAVQPVDPLPRPERPEE